MGTDSPSAPVGSFGAKSAVMAVAQHHQALVRFLVGFFLVLLLYTTLASQFGSQTAIGESPLFVACSGLKFSYNSFDSCNPF